MRQAKLSIPPKVTVATVCLNAGRLLEKTIASVAAQDYPDIEYIIVDGGSTDNTRTVIDKHDGRISRWISEPDNGVYHGMNRAIDMAGGQWLMFLNAGDTFVAANTITQVFNHDVTNADFVFGDYFYKTPNGYTEFIRAADFEQTWETLHTGRINRAWLKRIPCHQALFARTAVLKERPFDTRFRIAADHHLMFDCYRMGRRFLKVTVPVAAYLAGGFSQRRQVAGLWEKRKIIRSYRHSLRIDTLFAYLVVKAWIEKAARLNTFSFKLYQALKSRLSRIKRQLLKRSAAETAASRPDTLIFLHIPKTAGTSLQQIIRSNYSRRQIHELNNHDARRAAADFLRIPAARKAGFSMVLGHMWYGLHETLPGPSKYITVLREPVERIISHYRFVRRTPHHYLHRVVTGENLSLREYVSRGLSTELNNGQTRLLAGRFNRHVPFGRCPPDLLEQARDHLRTHFLVVGIQEEFEKTLLLLHDLLGWEISFFSQLVSNGRPEKKYLDGETLRTIERFNQLDIELYRYARTLFREQFDRISKRRPNRRFERIKQS